MRKPFDKQQKRKTRENKRTDYLQLREKITMKGKTISLYLIDGEPTKRIKCTLQNWTGIVYKIPRAMLDDCRDGTSDIVRHLKQTGIYFLL